jgi:hypothetical protein
MPVLMTPLFCRGQVVCLSVGLLWWWYVHCRAEGKQSLSPHRGRHSYVSLRLLGFFTMLEMLPAFFYYFAAMRFSCGGVMYPYF